MTDAKQDTLFVLKFYLRGLDTLMTYQVDQKVSERLDKFIAFLTEDPAKNISSKFFVFETLNGLLVMVSVNDVQGIQFSWQSGSASTSAAPQENSIARIYLNGRKEPWQLDFANPLISYDFVTDLDSADYESDDFVNFSNRDGEHTTIRIDEIVVAEVDSGFVREGERSFKTSDPA